MISRQTQGRGCGGLPRPPTHQTTRAPHPRKGGAGTYRAGQRHGSHAVLPEVAPPLLGARTKPQASSQTRPLSPTKAKTGKGDQANREASTQANRHGGRPRQG